MDDLMLSVVVITYNHEKYIRKTLECIINQKHNYKYELIVSDDCSTDNTPQIIREFEKKYPDIVVAIYNPENLGAMKNYYQAMHRCKGKYIMECGGDDYFLQGKIKKQIEYMENNEDVGMVYGYAPILNTKTGRIERRLYGHPDHSYETVMYGHKLHFCPATMCFRNKVFCDYLSEVDPENRSWLMEDYPFWLWLILRSKIHFMDDYFVVYRKISGSISHASSLRKRLEFERSKYEMLYYFSINEKMREKTKNDYLRELSNAYYVFGDYNRSLYYARKCKWSMLPNDARLKHLSLYFPGIRALLSIVYKKWFGIV